MEKREVAVREERDSGVFTPDPQVVEQALQRIRQYQAVVKEELIAGIDYGPVSEKNGKAVLFKSGAKKLLSIHGLADRYEILEEIEDWERGIFYYLVKCILQNQKTGKTVTEGLGSCNSKENKYRWRWVTEKELPPEVNKDVLPKKVVNGQYGKYNLYKIANDDIYSQVDTIQKMARERALLDAVLSACALSSVFAQDIDEEEL